MDRIINVKVGGNYLSKDNKNAGVKGEGNVTYLRITFDEGWDGYAKTVTFWDAYGGNPVKRTLTADLIENLAEDARTYLVPIPAEPLAEAGELTFVIDGSIDGKRQRSVADKLVVKDAPITDAAQEPTPPTPTQAEQFQQQYDGIMAHIQGAAIARNEAKGYRDEAEGFAQTTEKNTETVLTKASEAAQNAAKAENAVGKTNYIGDNGNWFAWDSKKNAFYDTGVKAQSGSTVYMGENPPKEADVWIDPNGKSGLYTPYIGENCNWFVFNGEKFVDSGIRALGYGYTEAESAEMKAYIDSKVIEFASRVVASITILGGAANWNKEEVKDATENIVGYRYGQVVEVRNANITENSKVDMQLSSEQAVVFQNKSLAFVTENEDGIITVYCVGAIPENDYTIQVTVTEVMLNGK